MPSGQYYNLFLFSLSTNVLTVRPVPQRNRNYRLPLWRGPPFPPAATALLSWTPLLLWSACPFWQPSPPAAAGEGKPPKPHLLSLPFSSQRAARDPIPHLSLHNGRFAPSLRFLS